MRKILFTVAAVWAALIPAAAHQDSATRPPQLPPIAESPGAPENAAATVDPAANGTSMKMTYNGSLLLSVSAQAEFSTSAVVTGETAIEQRLKFTCEAEAVLQFEVHGSAEAFAAETRGAAQERFPLVRTSHGLSNNRRNNAIYDRHHDWMLEFPEGASIHAQRSADQSVEFLVTVSSGDFELVFRPRYYQKHKNIQFFEPWTYQVRKDSITGWCSWWAYFRDCTQANVDAVMEVWKLKHMDDFGYRFIQLDDAYQGGEDGEMQHAPREFTQAYLGGTPATWLEWQTDKFPMGLAGYADSVRKHGFESALWVGCFFTDQALAEEHPEWFVRDRDGKPTLGRWVTYVLDATNPEVADKLIRPIFRGLKAAGIHYVKIDQLRHMLYDNLNQNQEYMLENGTRPDDVLRAYLQIAREEMGAETFILACWGVLPEVVGIADACRIAGDGFGPVSMQQYNSWNGIVWRNDPDHCDVSPNKAALGQGNVTSTEAVEAARNETIIRPALASISGSMLMLSDRPDVYSVDANLEGAKRASPVLFSVPGQLYDFDPSRTDKVKSMSRLEIRSGSDPSPIDAAQFGPVNAFWLNEFNMDYGDWVVLHRLNWEKEASAASLSVEFVDLGLDPGKVYLVHEFWSGTFLGSLKGEVELGALAPMGLQSLAIRERLDRPQLVTTTRHLSQGAAEIKTLTWSGKQLAGTSELVAEDPYTISLHVPDGFAFESATINGSPAETRQKGNLLELSYTAERTRTVSWAVQFE